MDKTITAKKSLFLAACSSFIAILLLGYSAYGWMTMAKSVSATAKDVTIIAPNNLEISAKSATEGFGTNIEIALKDIVSDLIDKAGDTKQFDVNTDKFSLMPASSYNGLEIWKTDYADMSGAAKCDENGYDPVNLAANGTGRIKYREETSSFEGYFLDIPLWLRTASASDLKIYLSDFCDITTVGDTNVTNTVRCAFLNSDKTDISAPAASNTITGVSGTTVYDALVYTGNGVNCARVIKDNNSDTLSNYVTPCKYITKDNPDFSAVTVCTVPAYTDDYHVVKINLRIWIEGEDRACVARIGNSIFSIKLGLATK